MKLFYNIIFDGFTLVYHCHVMTKNNKYTGRGCFCYGAAEFNQMLQNNDFIEIKRIFI